MAILKEEVGEESQSLAASATTCRRLLIDEPNFEKAPQVRLLLAQVLLRRGKHSEVIDAVEALVREHPKSDARCEGWLLMGDALSTQGEQEKAVGRYRLVSSLNGCSAIARQQAQYRLAWGLIKQKRTKDGANQLRQLLDEPEVSGLFKERVLRDLALAWSRGEPAEAAARLLLSYGGKDLGWQLVRQMAKQLLR
ncbi:MAG: hypothetical protein V1754_09205, partial [Pseudomonadota bacterium]